MYGDIGMRWQLKKERGKEIKENPRTKLFYALLIPILIAAFASLFAFIKDRYSKNVDPGNLVIENIYTDKLDSDFSDKVFGGFSIYEYTAAELSEEKKISEAEEENRSQQQYRLMEASEKEVYKSNDFCNSAWNYQKEQVGKAGFAHMRWLLAHNKFTNQVRNPSTESEDGLGEAQETPVTTDNLPANNLGVYAYFIQKSFEDKPPAVYLTSNGKKCPGFLFFEIASQGTPPAGSIKDFVLNVSMRNTGGKDITLTGYRTKVFFVNGGEAGGGGYVVSPINKEPIEIQVSTFHPISSKFGSTIGLEASKTMVMRLAPHYKTSYYGDGKIFLMYQLELMYFDGESENSLLVGNFFEPELKSCQYDWGGPEGACIGIVAQLKESQ